MSLGSALPLNAKRLWPTRKSWLKSAPSCSELTTTVGLIRHHHFAYSTHKAFPPEKVLRLVCASIILRDAFESACTPQPRFNPANLKGCCPLSHRAAGVGCAETQVFEVANCGLVAQLVEQRPFKPLVLGSSPSQPTSLRLKCFKK